MLPDNKHSSEQFKLMKNWKKTKKQNNFNQFFHGTFLKKKSIHNNQIREQSSLSWWNIYIILMKYWWKYSSDLSQKTISSYICWIPNPLVQRSPLFLSNQIQLYKPNSTGIAEVNLPADALAHPATGAPRAWAQCTTPKTATQTHHSATEFTEANMVALAFCVSSDSNTLTFPFIVCQKMLQINIHDMQWTQRFTLLHFPFSNLEKIT